MPKLNLLTLLPGDSQGTLIDKINYNSDQILTAGGGPMGLPGRKGTTGPIGPQGDQGVAGGQGLPGSRWYVQSSAPPPEIGGGNLGDPVENDYWLRSSDKEIFVYGPSGGGMEWIDTGVSLSSLQIFNKTPSNYDSSSSSFETDVVYYQDLEPQNFSMLLSDWGLNTSLAYTGYTGYGLNSEKSKFKIATDFGSEFVNLISFGRAALDSSNSGNGTFSNTHNPSIKWTQAGSTGATAGTPNIWDLQIYSPAGSLDVISVAGKIKIQSNQNRIETTNATGGTIVSFSPGTGYFQVLPAGSTNSSTTPYMGVNATGVGIKQLPKNNNFVVRGSASIFSTTSFENIALPIGTMAIEKGLKVGSPYANPYNIPVGFTGPSYMMQVSGAQGTDGKIFTARMDRPLPYNSWLSFGNWQSYPAAINGGTGGVYTPKGILSQEFATTSGFIGNNENIAGYFHSAGTGNYIGATGGNDYITQFKLETFYNNGSYLTTANKGKVLGLFSQRLSATGTGPDDRVEIGVHNSSTLRVFDATGGFKVNGSNANPLNSVWTKMSVENGGVYIGPNQAGASGPSIHNYWTSGGACDNQEIVWTSRQKIVAGGWNGLHIENEYDSSSFNPGYSCVFPNLPSRPKAIAITDYDFANGNKRMMFTVGYAGHTTIGLRGTVPGPLVPYRPDVAQLFVFGDVSVTGTVRAGAFATVSSIRYKDNVKPLQSSLDSIEMLNPVTFDWKETGKNDIGFIAEELAEVFPEIIDKTPEGEINGYIATTLIPILTKGMQELIEKVRLLEEEIKILKGK